MRHSSDWIAHFPALASLPAELRQLLAERGKAVELPAGSRIFGPGHAPESFILLLEGSVRVQQVSESGREIVLYRVAPGESCALTTACLLAHENYLAEAVAETDVSAIALPSQTFDELIARSPAFRRFVFASFSARVTNLLRLIDDVAFSRLDVRLAQKLVELSGGGDHVTATQQQLASELGTAREVVGRILTEFQRRGWVSPGRGHIGLVDRAAIQRLAGAA
jgi:CRP/FNR family transcriptional regulator